MAARRFGFIVIVLLAGCGVGEPRVEIRQTLDQQARDWCRGDIDGFMAAYWRSDELTFVAFPRAVDARTTTQPTITRGWQPVMERYRKRYPGAAGMGQLRFENLKVDVAGPQTAVVSGRYEVRRGGETLTGFFILDMVRMKDGWKIVRDRTYPD